MSPPYAVRVLAVDWSGARTGARKKIWLAEVVDGRMVGLESGRDRDEVTDFLLEEVRRDPRLVVGLDFAFSFPAWFCRQLGANDGPDVWRAVAARGERWLADCPDPFWGRPGQKRPDGEEHFRRTEHNFVLAHGRCNTRKGDRLAAEEHLARWSERNEAHGALLDDRFLDAGVPTDLDASRNVARWAYTEAERIGGTVWVEGSEVRPLIEGWREVMA